jgi:hypothetical protein
MKVGNRPFVSDQSEVADEIVSWLRPGLAPGKGTVPLQLPFDPDSVLVARA